MLKVGDLGFIDQCQLLLAAPTFNLILAVACFCEGFEFFGVYQGDGPTNLRVVGTPPGIVVLLHSPVKIISATHIERFVGAMEDINEMTHDYILSPRSSLATLGMIDFLSSFLAKKI